MNSAIRPIVLFLFLLTAPAFAGDRLLCCGADEVFVIDPIQPHEKTWSWRAEESPEIPEAFRPTFRSTDDCKPYEGGLLLITSSASGVALIHRRTKACLFLAKSRNAHSACLLPRGQIAVASSFGGDALQFFERGASPPTPATPVQSIPLVGAHGTVWDAKRHCLWALGDTELLQLQRGPAATNQWAVLTRYELPSKGGHDLSLFHDRKRLYVTSNTEVLAFDRETSLWTRQKGFGTQRKVKSVDRHPSTSRIVYHMGTDQTWWSDTVRFQPGDPIRLEGERLYKLRWDVPAPHPHEDRLIAAELRAIGAHVFFNRDGRILEVNANRSRIQDRDLLKLAACTDMTDLSLEQTRITAAGMAAIATLPKLEWLNLYQAQVGNAGLAEIAKLPALQHLPIGENGITDAGLKALAGNNKLIYLGLRTNPVSDAGLVHLAGLTQLKQLHLGETKVTRLGALVGLKRLEKIWLVDLNLAAGELETFRLAHPACEIVR